MGTPTIGAGWLDAAWMQRGLDALKEALDVGPELKKQMIEFLFESGLWDDEKLSFDAAIAKFNDSLNPEKPRRFSPSEVWALSRRFDRHQFFLAQADDLGYEVRKKPTEERRQDLLERIALASEQHNRNMELWMGDLKRLDGSGPALRVHPRFATGQGSFAHDETGDADSTSRGF